MYLSTKYISGTETARKSSIMASTKNIPLAIAFYNSHDKSFVGLCSKNRYLYNWLYLNKGNAKVRTALIVGGIPAEALDGIGTKTVEAVRVKNIPLVIAFYNSHNKSFAGLSGDNHYLYSWLSTNKNNAEVRAALVAGGIPAEILDGLGTNEAVKVARIKKTPLVITFYNNHDKSFAGLQGEYGSLYDWLSNNKDNTEVRAALIAGGIPAEALDSIGAKTVEAVRVKNISLVMAFYNSYNKSFAGLRKENPSLYCWLYHNKDNTEMRAALIAGGIPAEALDSFAEPVLGAEERIPEIIDLYMNKQRLPDYRLDNGAYNWLQSNRFRPEIRQALLAGGIPAEELNKFAYSYNTTEDNANLVLSIYRETGGFPDHEESSSLYGWFQINRFNPEVRKIFIAQGISAQLLDNIDYRITEQTRQNIAEVITLYENTKELPKRITNNSLYCWLRYNKNKPWIRERLIAGGVPAEKLDQFSHTKKKPDELIDAIIVCYKQTSELPKYASNLYYWLLKHKDDKKVADKLIAGGIPETVLDRFGKLRKNKDAETAE
jgi:hypothetical protein